MDERGATPVLTLLIAAIAIAITSAIGQNVVELAEKTLPRESVAAYVTQSDGKVEIVNPSHLAADLSKLRVVVNGAEVQLNDENGNGVWEPGERLTFTLPASENVVTFEVIYDGQTVYKSTYIKPLPLHSDKEFPTITYTGSYDVKVEDDTAVVAVKVYVGTDDGEELVDSFTPFGNVERIKECFKEYEETGEWSCTGFSKTSFSVTVEDLDAGKRVRTHFSGKTSTFEGNVTFVRIAAYDVSGKPASIVLVDDSPPKVTITQPKDGEEFVTTSSKVSVAIAASATDDYGILSVQLFLDGSKVADCTSSSCSATVQLGEGEHVVRAVAIDTTGQTTGDEVRVRVVVDKPPSIEVVSPKDGETVVVSSEPATIALSVKATDDFGLAKIEIFLNGARVKTCTVSGTSATCTYSAKLGTGSYTLTAYAYDTQGQSASATASFRVEVQATLEIDSVLVPEVAWKRGASGDKVVVTT